MPSAPPTPPSASFAMSQRMLVGSLMSGLVLVAFAIYFVFAGQGDALATPPLYVPVAQLIAGLAAHFLIQTIGYRVAALDRSLSEEDAATKARQAWQTTMILRFALSEFVAIASLAAAFVVTDGGYLTYLGGMLVSLVLMVVHVWPSAGPVGRIAEALEKGGRSSHLRETFGLDSSGPVRRL